MTEKQGATQDRGMIIVPQELLKKIDRNRDELSRAEFIEFCISNLLERGEATTSSTKQTVEATPVGQDEDAPISHSEFEEFKKNIKDLQRAYIDFLINYSLEPIEKASPEEQERFKEQVANLMERPGETR